MKLKFGIQIAMFNKGLALQIFKQVTNEENTILFSTPEFEIKTASEPEISGANCLYVRGDGGSNDKIMNRMFRTIGERDRYLKHLTLALQGWAMQEATSYDRRDLGHTQIINIGD